MSKQKSNPPRARGVEPLERRLFLSSATFGGTVWHDVDADGQRDARETPLGGWTINLYATSGSERGPLLQSTVSDAGGTYRFSVDIEAETIYEIAPAVPAGWSLTYALGYRATLGPGGHSTGGNFLAVEGSTIIGTVYDDTNEDGIYQFRNPNHNDLTLGGWTVFADLDADGSLDADEPSTLSRVGGTYRLGPLAMRAEPYVVRAVPVSPYRPVSPSGGAAAVDLSQAQWLRNLNFGFSAAGGHGPIRRYVVYGGSAAAGTPAADKFPLLPGQRASFANVSAFDRGINAVAIDVVGAPPDATWTTDDFDFALGDGSSRSPAPAATGVTTLRGAGANGSDRVTVTFPDNAVRNTWLRVAVLPTPRTGLAAPDVFYFGSLPGDTGGPGPLAVSPTDVARTRANVFTTFPNRINAHDFNRDGRVNALDVTIARNNQRHSLAAFTAPDAAVAPSVTASVAAPPDHRMITVNRRPQRLGRPSAFTVTIAGFRG